MKPTDLIGKQPSDELFEELFETAIYTDLRDQDAKKSYSVKLRCFCNEARAWKTQGTFDAKDLMKLQSLIGRTIKRLSELDGGRVVRPELWDPEGDGSESPAVKVSRAFRVGSIKVYIHQHGSDYHAIHTASFRDSEFRMEDQRVMGFSCYDLSKAAEVAYEMIRYLEDHQELEDFEEEIASITVYPIEPDEEGDC